MNQAFDWQKDYFHKDPWYGLNDWDPVIGFVRALMEDSEVPWCFDYTRKLILDKLSPVSQTLIQYVGWMQDERGIAIFRDKLKKLGPDDRTLGTPWCKPDEHLESICLDALAKIGGPDARSVIDSVRQDPAKSYLHERILTLDISERPRPADVPLPDDFPDILKDVHSMNAILRPDDDYVDGVPDWMVGSQEAKDMADQGMAERGEERRSKAEAIVTAWRKLPFPGKIEMLSGDGQTCTFKLKTRFAGVIHNRADPFSDMGVFNSGPKVEYPIGHRRWAHSHTFLLYQIPDGSLWNNEYTWDDQDNTITTHFREHVDLEQVSLNPDGKSVTLADQTLATAIETRGNTFTLKPNAAVRGVWDNPQKRGTNYYVRRANVMTPYKSLVYFAPLHQPIVNFLGAWLVDECENPQRFFNTKGDCIDVDGVVDELLIPLHEPKVLALAAEIYKPSGPDDPAGQKLPEELWPELIKVPPAAKLDRLLNVRFEKDSCGLAGWETGRDNGYNPLYDLNSDGVIDEQDQAILAAHEGKVYRNNLFNLSYHGANWVGTSYGCNSRHFADQMPIYILSYDYGAGYDATTGRIELFESLPPGTKLYVECYCDAPAAPGEDNIKVYLHTPI